MVGQPIYDALGAVEDEVHRQVSLKLEGRFSYTPADSDIPECFKLAMLMEEVGEVSTNVLRRRGLVTDGSHDIAALRKELIQVAAIAVAWVTAGDPPDLAAPKLQGIPELKG